MGTFEQKQEQAQKAVSASLAQPEKTALEPAQRQHPVHQLQRAIGNQAVQRMLQTGGAARAIQTKLQISEPGDTYEREADRIADQVMAAPSTGAVSSGPLHIQRFSGQPAGQTREAPASVDRVLASPGRPLEPALRQDMEQRFGYDFSQVRVHTGAAAEQSAQDVNALAYTVGHHITFGAGRFAPEMSEGRRLVAHELAHVLQNSNTDDSHISSANSNTLSRYTLDDCQATDRGTMRAADARATFMAGKALAALRIYAENEPALNPTGSQDQKVDSLLADSFGFTGANPFLTIVIENFRKIDERFTADDYQYECEDDCGGDYAYVYPFWTDIHLCMDKIRGKSVTFIAGVMLHEMSHYEAVTDDLEYFYYGSPATTSLRPTDAVHNADSYEAFAEEYYKLG